MKERVKVDIFLDNDVIDHTKSLSKMFMMDFDDVINLLLWMEMQKRKNNE